MTKQLTIKETVDNIIDELGRASDILNDIRLSEDSDKFACRYEEEISTLVDDITRTLQDELSYFKERIDLAMLMASAKGDIALPTVNKLYELEANYELPIMENGLCDTEIVYNSVEEIVENI